MIYYRFKQIVMVSLYASSANPSAKYIHPPETTYQDLHYSSDLITKVISQVL